MAVLSIKKLDITDKLRIVTGSFAFDASYPTGGEAVDFGLKNPYFVGIEPTSGFVFEYDSTNKKIKAFYADYDATADGALIELPNTSNLLTSVSARFVVVGE